MTSNELLIRLSKLMPSQFELVLSLGSIPRELLSGSTAPQVTRAAEVMRYIEQHNQLEQVARIVQQVDTGGGAAGSGPR